MQPFIKTVPNFISNSQTTELLDYCNKVKSYIKRDTSNNNYYNRKQISGNVLPDHLQQCIKTVQSLSFSTRSLNDIWVNTVKVSEQIDPFHTDETPWSVVVFLNDTFTGGDFEYKLNDKIYTIQPTLHTAVIMNCKIQHRVLPVQSGVRYSLVYFLN